MPMRRELMNRMPDEEERVGGRAMDEMADLDDGLDAAENLVEVAGVGAVEDEGLVGGGVLEEVLQRLPDEALLRRSQRVILGGGLRQRVAQPGRQVRREVRLDVRQPLERQDQRLSLFLSLRSAIS